MPAADEAGVLSVEIISEFLTSEEALVEEHLVGERPLEEPHGGQMITDPLATLLRPSPRAGISSGAHWNELCRGERASSASSGRRTT